MPCELIETSCEDQFGVQGAPCECASDCDCEVVEPSTVACENCDSGGGVNMLPRCLLATLVGINNCGSLGTCQIPLTWIDNIYDEDDIIDYNAGPAWVGYGVCSECYFTLRFTCSTGDTEPQLFFNLSTSEAVGDSYYYNSGCRILSLSSLSDQNSPDDCPDSGIGGTPRWFFFRGTTFQSNPALAADSTDCYPGCYGCCLDNTAPGSNIIDIFITQGAVGTFNQDGVAPEIPPKPQCP